MKRFFFNYPLLFIYLDKDIEQISNIYLEIKMLFFIMNERGKYTNVEIIAISKKKT